MDLNLIFDITNFNDDIFLNDRIVISRFGDHAVCKIIYGQARTVQIQKCLSASLASMGDIGTDIRGICLTVSPHHFISPSIADSICFFSISMSLN